VFFAGSRDTRIGIAEAPTALGKAGDWTPIKLFDRERDDLTGPVIITYIYPVASIVLYCSIARWCGSLPQWLDTDAWRRTGVTIL
jgi:hypothetical protein